MPPKRKQSATAVSKSVSTPKKTKASKEKDTSAKKAKASKGKATPTAAKKAKALKEEQLVTKVSNAKKDIETIAAPPKPSADSKKTFSLSSLLTDSGWSNALKAEMEKDYFKSLEKMMVADYNTKASKIFPPKDLIFNALNLTPLSKVRVVILGQDPYHDDGQAHGLAFSVPHGVKLPPSLKNMYKELEDDIAGFTMPSHGCLEKWAKEGVLLLNATLTVEAHKPNSHKSYGWQTFTDEVIRVVNTHCNKVVFLLWGNFAHKKEKLVDSSKHSVLKDAHPSPLSFGLFHHCKCFSRANKELTKAGLSPIDWKL